MKKYKLKWDVDDGATRFRHRIVLYEDGVVVKTGSWTTYQGIAALEWNDRTFCAVTAMYDGSLPIERVFEVSSSPTHNTQPLT